jgi:cyclase
MLSRNFNLQNVGDLEWLKDNYDFHAIASSIDELVVLNVDRDEKRSDEFAKIVSELAKDCFVPLAAGGGIDSIQDAYKLLNAGADKLVLNSPFYLDKYLVSEIADVFGKQCVVCSIDYKNVNGLIKVFTKNGKLEIATGIEDVINEALNLGAGELYVTSMQKDGTGQGLDFESIKIISQYSNLPIIASGGIGNFKQIKEGLEIPNVDAVSTANLFYFMEDGLIEARNYLKNNNIQLAYW